MKRKPVAVDLFSGVGGLSLGLERAGVRVRAAVEIDEDAVLTYRANLRGSRVLHGDIRGVTGPAIRKMARRKRIDILVGCAPCQGFCSLTRKNKQRDPRNRLLLEMVRLARSLRPKVILMENVPGLARKRIFREFCSGLRKSGYDWDFRVVQMADYGLPQSRRRLVMLAGLRLKIQFPRPTHSRAPKPGSILKPWVTVRDAIGGMSAPVTLPESLKVGGPQHARWHVVRDITERTKARLRAARPGQTRLDLETDLLPECHQGGYEGFRNVYGRMSWDSPAPTMTGGCTTSCKGRFGHPDRRRFMISVREAALLQTFPKWYEFPTDRIDPVCEMIGNAVPPLFATLLGRCLKRGLLSGIRRPR